MRLHFGDQCPAYSLCICGVNENNIDHCINCKGCKARFIDGVECTYSPTPTTVPKYKEGQELYKFFHLDSYHKMKVRALRWNGRFEWEYVFGRERTWYDESEVFATRREIEEFVIQKRARQLINDLMDYSKRYHIPLENLKQKLIQ